jgi:hypothetical protein
MKRLDAYEEKATAPSICLRQILGAVGEGVAYGLDLFPPPTPDFLFFFLRSKK